MMKPRTKIDRNCNNSIIAHYKMITDENGEVLIGERGNHYRHLSYDHVSTLQEPHSYRFYFWYMHKVGAPAYIDRVDHVVNWYIRGERFTDTVEYCVACGFNKLKTMQWVLKYGKTLPHSPDDI